jgi:tripartite-type tricarboxylate transporter receptor subunit TctC
MHNKLIQVVKFSIFALVLAVGLAPAAQAEFPERSVKIVVPYKAGGNTDVIARIFADHLSEALGKPVVIENRGGGGGTIGAALVAGAEADGYTLLFGTAGSHSINPNLRKIKYDPIKDFQPISTGVISSLLIVVHPSVEAKSLKELAALTSSGKVQYNYSSGGIGTLSHVAGELYNQKTGSKLTHVPYKGAGPAINDAVAGRIQVYMNNIPKILPHVKSGALRPLALGSAKRSSLLPDVPTTSEAGMQGMEMGSWYGLLAPAGTPKEAVAKLYAAMASAKDSKKVQERLTGIGSEAVISDSPEQFGEFMKQQLGWWADMLKNPAFQKKKK